MHTYTESKSRSSNTPHTNNLPTRKKPDEITREIIELATSLKNYTFEVSISNITARNYQHRRKTIAVNHELKELCKKKSRNLIDHGKIIKFNIKYVNGSKLHLK